LRETLRKSLQTKAKTKQKEFEFIRLEQILMYHTGSVWSMEFSKNGIFLATGGNDTKVRIWTVVGNSVDRKRWKKREKKKKRSTPRAGAASRAKESRKLEAKWPKGSIINPIPYREFSDHKRDIIDLDWSIGTNFLLSSSLDSTVMLWHPSREKCLSVYQHPEYVTSVSFHPDSSCFVTACFDSKIRLWKTLDQKVVAYQQQDFLATAISYSPDGKVVVVGMYNGQCVFYNVEEEPINLRFRHRVDCWEGKGDGRKITSIQFLNSKGSNSECLITTNDSRIRLYVNKDHQVSLVTKYKGLKNSKMQIGATFSENGKYVICGSEDGAIYIWNKEVDQKNFSLKRTAHSKSKPYEVIRVSDSKTLTATVAIFAPEKVNSYLERERDKECKTSEIEKPPGIGNIILCADQQGAIKIFVNYVSKPAPIVLLNDNQSRKAGRNGKKSRTVLKTVMTQNV